VIRPTRAMLLRTAHIQTALTELQDEDQRERIRLFNMHHNGQWRDVYAAELDPTPPFKDTCWEWVENPKKRSNVQGATLELLKELHEYLRVRKIRVKEMFAPYVPYGDQRASRELPNGARVDSETLLLALHRFHLALDLSLSDIFSVMMCLDPHCNGTFRLVHLQLLLDRVAKLPSPGTGEVASTAVSTQQLDRGATIATVSPNHRSFPSSFKRFLNALDETAPRAPGMGSRRSSGELGVA
jgi:hypothetical protein